MPQGSSGDNPRNGAGGPPTDQFGGFARSTLGVDAPARHPSEGDLMLTVHRAFSSFSVDDLDAAEAFYRDTLGLAVRRTPMGLELDATGGTPVFVYPKGGAHEPASHTVLNLVVPRVEDAARDLHEHGVELVRYPGFPHDVDGVVRSDDPRQGPTIAWFRDPARNVVALIEG
jgi:catechol 2,3-dioxygenase-like lactoylglutathione lyase family enzyme